MTMTIFNLPKDLIEEIFSRLPMKSMRAVRLTCKTLNTLSQSPSFTKLHIGKEAAATKEGETRMIVLMDYNLHLISVVFNGIDIDPFSEKKGKFSYLNDSDQVKISQIFNCEGLLLCILKDDSRFVVWNPYLGQTRWIEPRYSHTPSGWDRFSYALGYENKGSCRSYKLLRFIDYYYRPPESQFFWYEIYDFDSDLWTSLDVTPNWCKMFCNPGVSLKGNTYFCASIRGGDDHGVDDHIICFDFTSQRFGPLLPLPFGAGDDDYVTLSCVREEKLAVLLTHNEVNPFEFDIWVSTKIEAEKVWWSKFLTMDTTPLADMPISFTNGSFFIDEEKKVSMGFDDQNYHRVNIIGEGYFRHVDVGEPAGRNCQPRLCVYYVPSLVQIKQQPSGGERKQESDLEKCRYDQNMSRLAAFEKQVKEEDDERSTQILMDSEGENVW